MQCLAEVPNKKASRCTNWRSGIGSRESFDQAPAAQRGTCSSMFL